MRCEFVCLFLRLVTNDAIYNKGERVIIAQKEKSKHKKSTKLLLK